MLTDTDKISNRIKMMGLKRQHVAKQVGVSQTWLSLVLSNKQNLSNELKTKLFAYLGL